MDDLATTPLTEILREYRCVRALPKRARLKYAEAQLREPQLLADKFARSVEQFKRYENQVQPFNAKPPAFKEHHGVELIRMVDLAKRLSDASICRAESFDSDLVYLSRESDCLRVARGRELDDGTASKRAVVLDLLLVDDADGTPVFAEVKIRNDTDAVYGLVQILAAAAHLVTPSQRTRLAHVFPAAELCVAGPVDVYVLLYEPPARPLDLALRKAASELAETLTQLDGGRYLRRLAVLEVVETAGGFALHPAC